MANTQFTTQSEQMCQRVRRLYLSAGPTQQHSAVLASAFLELEVAVDVVRAIENELRQVHVALEDMTATIDTKHRRYQELFELAPDGYLVTSLDGMIHRANHAAAILLQGKEKDLIQRSALGHCWGTVGLANRGQSAGAGRAVADRFAGRATS